MKLEIYAPEFALVEINNYKSEIIQKTKISSIEFEILKKELAIAVEFIPIQEYKEHLKKALKISPDPNDIDFFALSLKFKLPLWTNDTKLKNQKNVKIYSTQDLLFYLSFTK